MRHLGQKGRSRKLTVSRGTGLRRKSLTVKSDLPIVPFASREAWEAWLEEEHAASKGVWLKIAKKGSGIESVTFPEALDAALCYGWIDGQRDRFDEDRRSVV